MLRLFQLILLVGTFGVWNIPLAQAQFSGAKVQELTVAAVAPDFTLKELDGTNISLKELRRKITILNFFTTW
jgi:cytochrome oxidase Cu insertion factor (SCO1/SenC/PrrC family)